MAATELSRNIYCFITICTVIHLTVFIIVTIYQYNRADKLRRQYARENTRMLQMEAICQLNEGDLMPFIDEINEILGTFNSEPKSTIRRDISKRKTSSLESLFNELLQVQMNVLEQHCTNNSHICVRGINGQKGDQGIKGQLGIKGLSGDKGKFGPEGQMGNQGETGDVGDIGIGGIKGIPGPPGNPGNRGSKGETGNDGIQGQKGDSGLPGQKGGKGTKGLPGQRGKSGARGDQGQKGTKGDQGKSGKNGDKGERGPVGPSGQWIDSECVCTANFRSPATTTNPMTSLAMTTTSIPRNKTLDANIGERKTIHCDVGNAAPSSVKWSKTGNTLNDRLLVSGADLVIPEVYKIDSGTYACVSDTGTGNVVSQTFTLNVSGGSNYDCDFEIDLCRWTQRKDDQLDWTRHQGATLSSKTGPHSDHTIGPAGHYIYLESSSGFNGYIADLSSPYFSPHHTYCLHFWYSMYGADVNELSVLTTSSRSTKKIWSLTGNQGDIWHHGNVTLTPTSLNYQILFRAIKGSGYAGDIAIDDIIILDGSCKK